MKKKKPTRERHVLPVAAKPKKRCAWRRKCTTRVDDGGPPFCNVHCVHAERDYIFISGLNPSARVPVTVSWGMILSAVRERTMRKVDEHVRHTILKRACKASGCPGTDSCDTYYSCRNCFSLALPPNHDLKCGFPECEAGRLANDKYCSWHVKCIYEFSMGLCVRCKTFCPVGRLCPQCTPLCQYVGGADSTPCSDEHTRTSRFCSSHANS